MWRVYSNPGPHSVASYDTEGDAKDIFLPGSPQTNSEVNGDKNLTKIIIQKNTKPSIGEHGPPTKKR
jgi:hypothetical protein